jgi:hypothetical protein
VATLPIGKVDNETWINQEYLGLYPRIEEVKFEGEMSPRFAVRDPLKGYYWRLKQWVDMVL